MFEKLKKCIKIYILYSFYSNQYRIITFVVITTNKSGRRNILALPKLKFIWMVEKW